MGKGSKIIDGLKPTLIMIVVDIMSAGVNVFYELAANDNMNLSILIAYRYIFAAVFMVPFALCTERDQESKRPTWTVLSLIFISGLGGSVGQNMLLNGVALTSATFATAAMNLVPAMTFVLAVTLRLEKLEWDKAAGRAKVGGTLLGLIGAMLLTFYQGPTINISSPNVEFLKNSQHQARHVAESQSESDQMLGAFLMICSCILLSSWLIIQTKIAELYPYPYSSIAITNVMASVQSTVYALLMVRDWSQWKLGWNIRLFTAVYTGTVASGIIFGMSAWCVQKKGPIFVSAFNPLMLLVVVIAGFFVLDERLYLGSVIGGTIIIMGLYAVLWGKYKETAKIEQVLPEKCSTHDITQDLRQSFCATLQE